MDHIYKSQLQSYALKQGMVLPVYAVEREGPPHAPRFRCTVTVCGQTFQSQDFFPTLKAAECAAAKVAMASLAQPNSEVVDGAYKNLLQEIAQKENSLLPVYATATSGPSHSPTFISTVEFAGKVFTGEEAKTKKLAELSAAKLAFMSIKNGDRDQNQTSSPSLPCKSQEATNINLNRSVQEVPSQPSQPSKIVTPDVPSKWVEVYEDELVLPQVLSAPANNDKKMNVSSPVSGNPVNKGTLNAVGTKTVEINSAAGSCSSPMHQNPTKEGTLDAPASIAMDINSAAASLLMPQNPTNDCIVEENEKKLIMGTGHVSIPTGQHVVCCPWKPEMTLPEGAEMVFRDDRFIAYRLAKSPKELVPPTL